MKRALASVCLGGSIDEKLKAAAAVGYDGIEIFEPDLTVSPLSPEEVAAMAADLGLEIVCLQPLRDVEGASTAERRAANLERAKRKIELALRLGTDLIGIPSSTAPDVVADRGRMATELADLAEVAQESGVRLAYEALSWGTRIHDSIHAWDIVQRVDHPNLGLLLDSYHFFVRENPLEWLDDIPGERIFLVQLADAPRFVMDTIRHSRHLRLFPGQGDYEVVDFVRRIAANGYDGWLSHEIFNDEFRAADPIRTAVDGYRSLNWLEEQLAGTEPPRTGPITVVELGGSTAWAVGSVLQQTGAKRLDPTDGDGAPAGDYALLLGDVVVIVGSETPAGHPGPSTHVRRLGVVPGPDLTALADRAMHNRITADEDSTDVKEPGEGQTILARIGHTDIVAVKNAKALAGWLPGHLPESDDGDRAPRIGLDEVAFGVASTEFAPTVLALRTMLGVEPLSSAEFADPGGLSTVTDLVDPDRSLRLRVQSCHGSHSRAGRFLDAVGAGVLHIAFAVPDLMAAAAALPSDLVLDIPDNYYEDLSARFGLDGDLVQQLHRARVLFERNGDGDLLRIVCQPTAGISIGFVERRDHDDLPRDSEPVVAAALDRRFRSRE